MMVMALNRTVFLPPGKMADVDLERFDIVTERFKSVYCNSAQMYLHG